MQQEVIAHGLDAGLGVVEEQVLCRSPNVVDDDDVQEVELNGQSLIVVGQQAKVRDAPCPSDNVVALAIYCADQCLFYLDKVWRLFVQIGQIHLT